MPSLPVPTVRPPPRGALVLPVRDLDAPGARTVHWGPRQGCGDEEAADADVQVARRADRVRTAGARLRRPPGRRPRAAPPYRLRSPRGCSARCSGVRATPR
ncbi:hypothetical protein LT493_13310 [Streptomyces tricolor]|nr:hypothetical protein [Streptomyces tricolor]